MHEKLEQIIVIQTRSGSTVEATNYAQEDDFINDIRLKAESSGSDLDIETCADAVSYLTNKSNVRVQVINEADFLDSSEWDSYVTEAAEYLGWSKKPTITKTTITKMVNTKGWELIKEWIKATHNEDHPYSYDSAAAEAWCSEAEEQMAQGNPPEVEMPANATISGRTETFTVPDHCIIEIEESSYCNADQADRSASVSKRPSSHAA